MAKTRKTLKRRVRRGASGLKKLPKGSKCAYTKPVYSSAYGKKVERCAQFKTPGSSSSARTSNGCPATYRGKKVHKAKNGRCYVKRTRKPPLFLKKGA